MWKKSPIAFIRSSHSRYFAFHSEECSPSDDTPPHRGSVGVDCARTLERPLIWFATEIVLPLSFAAFERSSAAVRCEVEPLAVLHFRLRSTMLAQAIPVSGSTIWQRVLLSHSLTWVYSTLRTAATTATAHGSCDLSTRPIKHPLV